MIRKAYIQPFKRVYLPSKLFLHLAYLSMFPSVMSWTLLDRSVLIFSIWSLFSRPMLFPLYFSVVILFGCGGDCSELGAWSSLESSFHRFCKEGKHISNTPLTLKVLFAQDVFQQKSQRSRLKELLGKKKDLLNEEIRLGEDASFPTMIPFYISPGWCYCEGMRPLTSGFVLSTVAPQWGRNLACEVLHCPALSISLYSLWAYAVLLPFMAPKYSRSLRARTA